MKRLLILLIIPLRLYGQSGIEWYESFPVSDDNSFGNNHPRIVLDRNENPMVIWGHEDNVYFSRWDGTAFTTPVLVNPAGMSVFTASWAGPDIASKGDTLYIVFKENPETSEPVYCVHSYDAGNTFSEPVIVDGMIGDNISRFPSVTTNDDGQPIVAFMKLDADFANARYVVATSDDFGNSFNMDVNASAFSGGDVCDCCPAGIVSNGNYVATLYRDNLDNLRNSWAGISTNGGNTFNGVQIDQTNWIINSCPSTGPDGIIIGDSLYSVFMSAGEGDERVYFSATSLSDLNDLPDLRLTGELLELNLQNYPRVSHYNNAVAVVWKQSVGMGNELPLLFSDNITERFPAQFDTVEYLEMPGIENADVAVSSEDVHVVWQSNNTGKVLYRKGKYSNDTEILDPGNKNVFVLFPNPADNFIQIGSASNAIINSVEIRNAQGASITMESGINNPSYIFSVSLYSPGFYSICITDISGNKNYLPFIKI